MQATTTEESTEGATMGRYCGFKEARRILLNQLTQYLINYMCALKIGPSYTGGRKTFDHAALLNTQTLNESTH